MTSEAANSSSSILHLASSLPTTTVPVQPHPAGVAPAAASQQTSRSVDGLPTSTLDLPAQGLTSHSKDARPKLPRPTEPVSCPRCGSADTKFCYFNNYNAKQPRYFCKVSPASAATPSAVSSRSQGLFLQLCSVHGEKRLCLRESLPRHVSKLTAGLHLLGMRSGGLAHLCHQQEKHLDLKGRLWLAELSAILDSRRHFAECAGGRRQAQTQVLRQRCRARW